MGNIILKWLIGVLFVLFAVVAAIAGFGLVTSGGNQEAKSAAKSKLTNAIIGIVIVLAAFLLVDTILRALLPGDTGEITGYGPWAEVKCHVQVSTQDAPSAQIPTPSGVDCTDTASLITKYSGSPVGLVAAETTALIACYKTDGAIAAALDASQEFTVEGTAAREICAATNGYPVCSPCSHSQSSCHYGRGTGNGALAVDFNSNGSITEAELCALIKAKQPDCGGRVLCESSHTHISADSCP